jgi:hypothetical protein
VEELCVPAGGNPGTAAAVGRLVHGDGSLASLAVEWSSADKAKCIVSDSRVRDLYASRSAPACFAALCESALRSRLELIGPAEEGHPPLSALQREHRAMLEEYLAGMG